MTFTDWLQTHRTEQSAIGDLAEDTSADPTWPGGSNYQTLHEYLLDVGAEDDALETFEKAFTTWTLSLSNTLN